MTTGTAERMRIGFDCESHLIERGRNAPRMVCLTLHGRGSPPAYVEHRGRNSLRTTATTWSALLTGLVAVRVFRALLEDERVELVAHNAPFDLAVMAVAAATRPGSAGPLLQLIFEALDAERIRDTSVRESLLAIAHDRTGFDPVTGGKMSLGLAHMMLRYFGVDRSNVKGKAETCPTCCGNGATLALQLSTGSSKCSACDGFGMIGPWRLRYAQLDGVPVNEWPDAAVSYAMQDAADALLVFDAQAVPDELPAGVLVSADGTVTDEHEQLRSFFALHLASCHGPRTDKHAVEVLAEGIEDIVIAGRVAAIEAGFVRDADGVASLDTATVQCKAHRDARGVRQSKRNPFNDSACALCGGTGQRPKKGKPFSKCVDALRELVNVGYDSDPPLTKPDKEGNGGGNIKTDAETLLGSGNDSLIAYAEDGAYRKLSETYVPLLRLGIDRPITSRMGFILKTGRASARNPTLQTGPRRGSYRECFVARPGRVYISTDYHLAELGSLAQVLLWLKLGDTMAVALRNGEDLHLRLAAKLGGTDYSTAFAAYHDKTHPLHIAFAGSKTQTGHRQLAKVGNFGFPGGLGAATFVSYARNQGVELAPTFDEGVQIAAQIRALWFKEWPEMQGYFDYISRGTTYGATTIRQFVSGRLRGGVGFCDGCNSLFQGLTADGAKRAMFEVSRACFGAGPDGHRSALYRYRCRPFNFIHDEIMIEAPDDTVDDGRAMTECGDELTRIMIESMQRYLPDVPVKASPAAMRRWSKKAEEVRALDGRLLVWGE